MHRANESGEYAIGIDASALQLLNTSSSIYLTESESLTVTNPVQSEKIPLKSFVTKEIAINVYFSNKLIANKSIISTVFGIS